MRGFHLPPALFSPGMILLFLAVYLLTISVFFPFLIRFGFIGLGIGLVGFQVLGIVLMMLASRRAQFSVVTLIQGIASGLGRLRTAAGAPAYHLIILLFILGLYAASCAVSIAILKRKDL
jgi:hypothetical protein